MKFKTSDSMRLRDFALFNGFVFCPVENPEYNRENQKC